MSLLQQNILDVQRLLPEILLFGVFGVMLTADQFLPRRRKKWIVTLGIAGLAVVGCRLVMEGMTVARSGPVSLFGGMMVVDHFAIFFQWIFLVTTVVALLMAVRSDEIEKQNEGEYYILTVAVCFGMFFLAASTHLLMILLSFEMISIVSYVLAGYLRGDPRSSESGIKYVIYGAFTTGIMIYGMSLLYGLTGSLQIERIHDFLMTARTGVVPVTVILLMISAGMLYKIAAVPFHMWSPDVYEGAPTAATAFFSVGPKAAGFAILIRFFLVTFGKDFQVDWRQIMAILSMATMTIGNYTALRQENVKRMLAYSSISHAGYLLMGMAVASPAGRSAILFYLLVYMVMNSGAFIVVLALENILHDSDLAIYRGIGTRLPLPAVTMVIFLVSLAGLPPTAGFVGKFFLFKAVIAEKLYLLALVGIVNSLVALYYYMRVVKAMYMEQPEQALPQEMSVTPLYRFLLVLSAVPILYLGIFFETVYHISAQVVFG
ncbi:MAG: NADH-quinone oxidoreductase subunit N [Deltaproteobacteria bacterium]|nr:NADH-quinone oxidoreductase subunit N [Deltaproteobacteria bacterium]